MSNAASPLHYYLVIFGQSRSDEPLAAVENAVLSVLKTYVLVFSTRGQVLYAKVVLKLWPDWDSINNKFGAVLRHLLLNSRNVVVEATGQVLEMSFGPGGADVVHKILKSSRASLICAKNKFHLSAMNYDQLQHMFK